jgi:hypothetical protein
MSDQVHYELFVRRKVGAQWTLDMATEIRTHALQTAEEALEQGRAVAVRVSKETLDPDSREYKSISIFTKGQVDGGKPKKVQEDLEPTSTPPTRATASAGCWKASWSVTTPRRSSCCTVPTWSRSWKPPAPTCSTPCRRSPSPRPKPGACRSMN